MRHLALPTGIVAIACGLLAYAGPALALTAETWVSRTGSDAGGCPITAPCRTFTFAHGQTSAGGTINVLSSGNFGPLTITKSISIVADGADAVINTAAGGAAVIVNGANIVVSLRGLTIDANGGHGISFVNGAALHVRGCVIRRSNDGIRFAPSSKTSELFVTDSTIADTLDSGVQVQPTGSSIARVVLDRVRVENALDNGFAFVGTTTTGSITATVRDSVTAGNSGIGLLAFETGGGSINVLVDRTASVNNSTGISAIGASATIRIGDSTVSGNTTGLALSTGAIRSYGTNKVDGNTTDGSPTTTIVMK
jgi:hypothetical protein